MDADTDYFFHLNFGTFHLLFGYFLARPETIGSDVHFEINLTAIIGSTIKSIENLNLGLEMQIASITGGIEDFFETATVP